MRRASFGFLVVLLAASMLLAATGPSAAQGILSTKHNLTTAGLPGNPGDIKTSGTNEVCVFCHTPHGSSTAAPLWNRRVNAGTTYTMYTSSTLDATPSQSNMGVSLACLSCHDGTIAFDALRNLPGSDGYNNDPPAAGVTNWTFGNAATNKMMPANRVTNLGTDLSNDHPIAMLYSQAKSPSSGSDDENSGFQNTTLINNRTWVRNPTLLTQVPLYDDGRVQCATCHDPHRTTTTFLRIANDESKLCRTCHKKDG